MRLAWHACSVHNFTSQRCWRTSRAYLQVPQLPACLQRISTAHFPPTVGTPCGWRSATAPAAAIHAATNSSKISPDQDPGRCVSAWLCCFSGDAFLVFLLNFVAWPTQAPLLVASSRRRSTGTLSMLRLVLDNDFGRPITPLSLFVHRYPRVPPRELFYASPFQRQ